MIFQEVTLKGAFIIDPERQEDERGFFARTWCQQEFEAHGLKTSLVQCSISFNMKRGTLRGMHYQSAPYQEVKLVRCTMGVIYDVIIDLRPSSITFMQWIGVELSAEDRRMLYIPEGFAHGFQTLVDNTEIFYQMSENYHPECEQGVRWDDPSFKILWPILDPALSDKDKAYPDFVPRRRSPLGQEKTRVLIAGIGGASLGTEIFKSLKFAEDRYRIFGCDVSPFAFGHYQEGFEQTFTVDRHNYIESVLEICKQMEIPFVIPGGEEPLVLLSSANETLKVQGLRLVANSTSLVNKFTDKATTFRILSELGFPTPQTLTAEQIDDLNTIRYPCVVKPATGSGGSHFVFLAGSREDAILYVNYLIRNGRQALVQEYVPEAEGEFSFGVLSVPGKGVIGSICMKRLFECKLSIHSRSPLGTISSPYSQGLIGEFESYRRAAEQIAAKIGSVGPLNIQGRVKGGILMPFEINPRFSGSTYLRALAGFNEVDLFLRYMIDGTVEVPLRYRYGYYFRSLSEVFVKEEDLKQ